MRCSRRSYKRFSLGLPFFFYIAFPLLQFVAFHCEAVYSLNLRTHLYDRAYWVSSEPLIVVLGSSIARYGIVPEIIARNSSLKPESVVNIRSLKNSMHLR